MLFNSGAAPEGPSLLGPESIRPRPRFDLVAEPEELFGAGIEVIRKRATILGICRSTGAETTWHRHRPKGPPMLKVIGEPKGLPSE